MSNKNKPIITEKEEIKEIEILIGKILRIGVGFAVILLLLGLFLLLFSGKKLNQITADQRNLLSIIRGISFQNSESFLLAGLLVLIFTPILRVIASIFSFAKERDFLYVVITSLVLLILLIALFCS